MRRARARGRGRVSRRPRHDARHVGGPYVARWRWIRLLMPQEQYNIRFGRSRNVTGPFLDQAGKSMEKGGGTLLLGTQNELIGRASLDLHALELVGYQPTGMLMGTGRLRGGSRPCSTIQRRRCRKAVLAANEHDLERWVANTLRDAMMWRGCTTAY